MRTSTAKIWTFFYCLPDGDHKRILFCRQLCKKPNRTKAYSLLQKLFGSHGVRSYGYTCDRTEKDFVFPGPGQPKYDLPMRDVMKIVNSIQ